MPQEFLFDVLKKQADRHLNTFKKQNANFFKLLKKVRRQYLAKYKKGLISKDAIVKIIDKAEKYINDQENERNMRLKELVDQFVSLKNARKSNCNVCLTDLRNSADNNNLISVYEETDSLTNLNNTITAANDVHQETITGIEDTTMIHDIDVTFEEMDVVNDNLNVTIVESSISDGRQLQVTLEDIANPPIDEMEEEIPIENDTMEFEQINLEKSDITTVETVSEKSSSAERLNSLHNKSSVDKTIFDRAIVQNMPVSKTPSFDSSVNSSNKLSTVNQADRTTSLSSNRTTTKTPQTSGLFKSKYHLNFGSNQKLAQKPQIKTNSVLKKKTDDVHNQKRLIDEERQRKLKDNEFRQEKIAGLKNICATVKPVNQHGKVITKAAVPLVRDMTRTDPRTVHTKPALKPQSSNKPTVALSSMKSLQQKQSVSTAPKPLASALKPINKPNTRSSISEATAPISVEFKTPVAVKTKPVLSESCRKIVVNHDSYSLDGLLSDNSDEDEENVGQIVPAWANKQSGTLGRLSEYHTENTDSATIFYPASLLLHKMTSSHVFAKYEHKPKKRTSSAVWK